MAPASLCNVKLISAFVVEQVCVAGKRGYASKSGSMMRSGAAMMSKKGGEEVALVNRSWGPDPVTGYYRPEGVTTTQADAAEMREMLFNNKTRRN
ncbi:protein SENESCENCE-ASSOCIATED GENE 21, mitochondrial-like [Apium graveolens]|uniref:protein SENESCENCE-ASSOCIATED GENE 21, mitochondrial-like n=1 Tax=Apium graveolens TaxID=4045 RepID=UPI003D79654B